MIALALLGDRHKPTMKIDSAPRILIADDQPDVLEALRLLLKGEGYQIESAASPQRCSPRWRRAISTS